MSPPTTANSTTTTTTTAISTTTTTTTTTSTTIATINATTTTSVSAITNQLNISFNNTNNNFSSDVIPATNFADFQQLCISIRHEDIASPPVTQLYNNTLSRELQFAVTIFNPKILARQSIGAPIWSQEHSLLTYAAFVLARSWLQPTSPDSSMIPAICEVIPAIITAHLQSIRKSPLSAKITLPDATDGLITLFCSSTLSKSCAAFLWHTGCPTGISTTRSIGANIPSTLASNTTTSGLPPSTITVTPTSNSSTTTNSNNSTSSSFENVSGNSNNLYTSANLQQHINNTPNSLSSNLSGTISICSLTNKCSSLNDDDDAASNWSSCNDDEGDDAYTDDLCLPSPDNSSGGNKSNQKPFNLFQVDDDISTWSDCLTDEINDADAYQNFCIENGPDWSMHGDLLFHEICDIERRHVTNIFTHSTFDKACLPGSTAITTEPATLLTKCAHSVLASAVILTAVNWCSLPKIGKDRFFEIGIMAQAIIIAHITAIRNNPFAASISLPGKLDGHITLHYGQQFVQACALFLWQTGTPSSGRTFSTTSSTPAVTRPTTPALPPTSINTIPTATSSTIISAPLALTTLTSTSTFLTTTNTIISTTPTNNNISTNTNNNHAITTHLTTNSIPSLAPPTIKSTSHVDDNASTNITNISNSTNNWSISYSDEDDEDSEGDSSSGSFSDEVLYALPFNYAHFQEFYIATRQEDRNTPSVNQLYNETLSRELQLAATIFNRTVLAKQHTALSTLGQNHSCLSIAAFALARSWIHSTSPDLSIIPAICDLIPAIITAHLQSIWKDPTSAKIIYPIPTVTDGLITLFCSSTLSLSCAAFMWHTGCPIRNSLPLLNSVTLSTANATVTSSELSSKTTTLTPSPSTSIATPATNPPTSAANFTINKPLSYALPAENIPRNSNNFFTSRNLINFAKTYPTLPSNNPHGLPTNSVDFQAYCIGVRHPDTNLASVNKLFNEVLCREIQLAVALFEPMILTSHPTPTIIWSQDHSLLTVAAFTLAQSWLQSTVPNQLSTNHAIYDIIPAIISAHLHSIRINPKTAKIILPDVTDGSITLFCSSFLVSSCATFMWRTGEPRTSPSHSRILNRNVCTCGQPFSTDHIPKWCEHMVERDFSLPTRTSSHTTWIRPSRKKVISEAHTYPNRRNPIPHMTVATETTINAKSYNKQHIKSNLGRRYWCSFLQAIATSLTFTLEFIISALSKLIKWSTTNPLVPYFDSTTVLRSFSLSKQRLHRRSRSTPSIRPSSPPRIATDRSTPSPSYPNNMLYNVNSLLYFPTNCDINFSTNGEGYS